MNDNWEGGANKKRSKLPGEIVRVQKKSKQQFCCKNLEAYYIDILVNLV